MELLVVVFIIIIISSLVTVSFLSVKRSSRDSKRISDIMEIKIALANYKLFEGSYPTTLTPGQALTGSVSSSSYMVKIPSSPAYQDFDCPNDDYTYIRSTDGQKYKIGFCLEGKTKDYTAGAKCVVSGEITDGECTAF